MEMEGEPLRWVLVAFLALIILFIAITVRNRALDAAEGVEDIRVDSGDFKVERLELEKVTCVRNPVLSAPYIGYFCFDLFLRDKKARDLDIVMLLKYKETDFVRKHENPATLTLASGEMDVKVPIYYGSENQPGSDAEPVSVALFVANKCVKDQLRGDLKHPLYNDLSLESVMMACTNAFIDARSFSIQAVQCPEGDITPPC